MNFESEFNKFLRDMFVSGGVFFAVIYFFDKYDIFYKINSNPVWIYLFVLGAFLWFGKMWMRGMILFQMMGRGKPKRGKRY